MIKKLYETILFDKATDDEDVNPLSSVCILKELDLYILL